MKEIANIGSSLFVPCIEAFPSVVLLVCYLVKTPSSLADMQAVGAMESKLEVRPASPGTLASLPFFLLSLTSPLGLAASLPEEGSGVLWLKRVSGAGVSTEASSLDAECSVGVSS